jgi:hypothetical protein
VNNLPFHDDDGVERYHSVLREEDCKESKYYPPEKNDDDKDPLEQWKIDSVNVKFEVFGQEKK